MTLRALPWYLCAALTVALCIVLHIYGVRGRTIADQQRSIDYGARVAAAFIHADSIASAMIEAERSRAKVLEAELQAIRDSRSRSRVPLPPVPATDKELKDQIMQGVNTR
jgi:hypothetical protein